VQVLCFQSAFISVYQRLGPSIMKTVGILALQGDFEAHSKAIEKAGARAIEVRSREEMAQCDGLILPGGESSTMLKLLEYENLLEPLREFGERKPIYGTCAGAILLAKVVSHPAQLSLGLMDIDVERNGYGRQIDSRIAKLDLNGDAPFEAVFIRAPIIRRAGAEVRVLAKYNGDPVWAEQGRHMVTTFHPELTGDVRVHRRFIEKL
jgi:pyridoxal 5'-phosphate synthase pdxT subunit